MSGRPHFTAGELLLKRKLKFADVKGPLLRYAPGQHEAFFISKFRDPRGYFVKGAAVSFVDEEGFAVLLAFGLPEDSREWEFFLSRKADVYNIEPSWVTCEERSESIDERSLELLDGLLA